MIAPGRMYHLTRQIRTPDGRIITAVRRCRVLAAEGDMVIVDNGDGTHMSVGIKAKREYTWRR